MLSPAIAVLALLPGRPWRLITRAPDGSELFGLWYAGPVLVAIALWQLWVALFD